MNGIVKDDVQFGALGPVRAGGYQIPSPTESLTSVLDLQQSHALQQQRNCQHKESSGRHIQEYLLRDERCDCEPIGRQRLTVPVPESLHPGREVYSMTGVLGADCVGIDNGLKAIPSSDARLVVFFALGICIQCFCFWATPTIRLLDNRRAINM